MSEANIPKMPNPYEQRIVSKGAYMLLATEAIAWEGIPVAYTSTPATLATGPIYRNKAVIKAYSDTTGVATCIGVAMRSLDTLVNNAEGVAGNSTLRREMGVMKGGSWGAFYIAGADSYDGMELAPAVGGCQQRTSSTQSLFGICRTNGIGATENWVEYEAMFKEPELPIMIKSGEDQAASGAIAGEVWIDTDDSSVNIGV